MESLHYRTEGSQVVQNDSESIKPPSTEQDRTMDNLIAQILLLMAYAAFQWKANFKRRNLRYRDISETGPILFALLSTAYEANVKQGCVEVNWILIVMKIN